MEISDLNENLSKLLHCAQQESTKMQKDEKYIAHALLLQFHLDKSVTEAHDTLRALYGREAVKRSTCEQYFQRFRAGDTTFVECFDYDTSSDEDSEDFVPTKIRRMFASRNASSSQRKPRISIDILADILKHLSRRRLSELEEVNTILRHTSQHRISNVHAIQSVRIYQKDDFAAYLPGNWENVTETIKCSSLKFIRFKRVELDQAFNDETYDPLDEAQNKERSNMPLDSLCNYTMPSSSSMPSTSGISTSNMEKQTVDRVSTEIMTEYLRNQENLDCIVSIYHAKVAQKSYAKEKRFFCPPPCIYRKGTKGWQLRKSRLQTSFQKSNGMMNHNANSSPNDQFDLLELCCTVGITAPGDCLEKQKLAVEQEKVIVDFRGKDFCKVTLYISDSDKRKYFTLDADFFYNHTPTNNVSVLGSFSSQRIKVISKPPKKKHSIINKTNDCKYLCIPSGTKVALFNRRASQASLTKFLHVENENFNANSDKWSAFTIYLVDEKDEQTSPTSESYCVKDGYINYGSIVRLVDSASGLALPNLRICKVEKNEVLLNIENETVSQLHKCAFQMVDQRMTYLHLYNDGASTLSQIQLITAKSSNINTDTISDGAIWTIVSADTVEYKFYEALGPVQIPVTPVPVINGLNMEASESHLAYIEISGSNFLVALTVWLGSTPIETHVRSKELIRCPLPALSKLNSEWPSGRVSEDEIEFPLSLVRHDGVIYSTSFTIKYSLSNSSMGRPGGVPLNVEFEQA